MNQKDFERSIDEIIKLGAERIVLTGFGEPFLDKRLELKIAYAKKNNLSTYIISNGSILNNKRAKGVLEAGLDEIRISFYGMRKETYNKVMVGLDYQKTHDSLINFINLRNTLGVKTKIQLSYLTMPENQEDEEFFKDYWEPKVDALEIWRPHNFGDGRDYRDTNNDQLKANKITCGRPENGPLQIQWNGEVIPCCYDYNNKIILGNAFENSVLNIINNEKYKLLRYAHSIGEFNIFPYCDQCDQLLPHSDALVYTNRHNLPAEIAVKLSNTDLYNLVDAKEIDQNNLTNKYNKNNSTN
jgi:MoaA/NifB/PqqE/SkfB family radical SAM enzyme